MSELACIGPDGGNLLGYLSALGALVTLDRVWPERDVRLAWRLQGGWKPVLHMTVPATEEDVTDVLATSLARRRDAAEFHFAQEVNVPAAEFRKHLENAVAKAGAMDRATVDMLAAFGSDGAQDNEGRIETTSLRAVGAGQQRFLDFLRKLAQETQPSHIREALFAEWTYRDGDPSMRWDPIDFRPYALRADDPSRAPIKTVRGANRLAIEALACFTTVPRARGLATTACTRVGRDWVVHWPIHLAPLSVRTITCLLRAPELCAGNDPTARAALRGRGVCEVFASRRITIGRYRNFEAAEPLLGAAQAARGGGTPTS